MKLNQASFGRHKVKVAVSPLAAGGTVALASYLMRMKALGEEAVRSKSLSAKLKTLERAEKQSTGQASLASTNVDSFLVNARKDVISDTRDRAEASDALTAEMEADIAGYSYVRDGGVAAAAFAAGMLAVFVVMRSLGKTEKKMQAQAKPEGPAVERKGVQETPAPAHAQAEPPKHPTYFDEYYFDLRRALRGQLDKHAGAVAEAALVVLPLADIHRILENPAELGPCIGSRRHYYEEVVRRLLDAGFEKPEEIFRRMDFPPKKPAH